MHDLSRRSLLAGLGTLGIAAAVSSTFGTWAQAAPPLEGGDWELLRSRWVDLLTGRDQIDPGSPVFTAALESLDGVVDELLDKLDTSPDRTRVFVDHPLSNDSFMATDYTRLATLAQAWATPGSRHEQSASLLEAILAGLQDLHRLVYNADQSEFGNWWSWEIGASRALANTMALVRDHIAPEDLEAYCAAIDRFVPDPWKQFAPPRTPVVSTGANRVDLCMAIIIRSLVTGDEQRMRHAVEGLSTTWQYVTSGDGFFRDGSFIQHSTIGYTGTYGLVLLGGLSKLFALLAGTGQDVTDPSRAIIDDAVESSYAPLVFRGQMMDAVRGRAVSREDERSYDDGDGAIEAILRLALAVDAERAERWRGLCRQWIEAAREGAAAHDILQDASIVRTALVHALMTSEVAARPDAGAGRLFPGMDRLVHRGRDNAWALTLAMCSRRITWYECGNGENDLGAQTSSGMTYLYQASADQHFDDEFWPTSDLAAPPGTTVDTIPLPPRVEGQWGARCPQNEWTGGSVLEDWSLAGQHLIGPGSTGLHARKTWFAGPDVYVCLGADISAIPVPQERERFVAAADAHVNDGPKADTNAGSAKTLLVKTVRTADSGYTRQTYLRFEPTAVEDGFDRIVLNLYAGVNDGGGTSDTIAVHRTEDFEEATLTWSTRPAIGELLAEVTVSGSHAWRQADLTEHLREQLLAGQGVTLAITQDLAAGRAQGLSIEIRSRESGEATAPFLAVTESSSADGRTKSVVEHRSTGTAAGRLLVDSREIGERERLEHPRWAHLEGTAGYVFLEPVVLAASVAERSGTWRRVNTGGSEQELRRHYATLEVLHPGEGSGSYAYLVEPGASADATRRRAADPGVVVEANTEQVQAVTSGKVTAASFWRAGAAAGMTVDGPACVLARRTPGMAAVAISDPTQTAEQLTLELADAPWTRVSGEGVSMSRQDGAVRVRVDVAGRAGVPVTFQLHKG
ncbi:polysaccharide lyase family 8 super-sandwich domain-containing protein [Brachybacterium hainanense]|uniref:Polysaccharide lyase family 8 super-sandwich domain-containing protein n=1 Tax=Brachybacterium hainanense TaxID=1541174 RepID=A0ABV6RBH9_9MICO